ncbi:hypothetical protein D3C80_1728590 [compost metagenome]
MRVDLYVFPAEDKVKEIPVTPEVVISLTRISLEIFRTDNKLNASLSTMSITLDPVSISKIPVPLKPVSNCRVLNLKHKMMPLSVADVLPVTYNRSVAELGVMAYT